MEYSIRRLINRIEKFEKEERGEILDYRDCIAFDGKF